MMTAELKGTHYNSGPPFYTGNGLARKGEMSCPHSGFKFGDNCRNAEPRDAAGVVCASLLQERHFMTLYFPAYRDKGSQGAWLT